MLPASGNPSVLNTLVPIDDANLMSPESGLSTSAPGDFCTRAYKTKPKKEDPGGENPMLNFVHALIEYPKK